MKWTEQRPTTYGVYWFRGVIRSDSGRVEIKLPESILVRFSEPKPVTGEENSLGVIALERRRPLEPLVTDAIEHWDGEWAGPITPRTASSPDRSARRPTIFF